MKVVLICRQEEFSEAKLNEIKKIADVVWIKEDFTDLHKVKELYDNDEKILAISPVPLDWKFPPDLYSKLKNVRYLCLVTTSYEFLDMKQCKINHILVTNIPHYATDAVAEQGLLMLLALSKRLPMQIKTNYKYEFSDMTMGDNLFRKRAGIIGLGDIGKKMADTLFGIGMDVSYWSPKSRDRRYNYLPLEKLLMESDVVFPFIVAKEETFGLLNKEILKNIKKDCYFIGLIDERIWDKDFLLERVKNGQLAGLAFESNEEKMTRFEGNVFVVPPFAWYSKQSLEDNINVWTKTITACLNNKPLNLVTN